MRLISKGSGVQLKVGDNAIDFRGDRRIITAIYPPRHSASEGHVQLDDFGMTYASVIDAEFVDRDDR